MRLVFNCDNPKDLQTLRWDTVEFALSEWGYSSDRAYIIPEHPSRVSVRDVVSVDVSNAHKHDEDDERQLEIDIVNADSRLITDTSDQPVVFAVIVRPPKRDNIRLRVVVRIHSRHDATAVDVAPPAFHFWLLLDRPYVPDSVLPPQLLVSPSLPIVALPLQPFVSVGQTTRPCALWSHDAFSTTQTRQKTSVEQTNEVGRVLRYETRLVSACAKSLRGSMLCKENARLGSKLVDISEDTFVWIAPSSDANTPKRWLTIESMTAVARPESEAQVVRSVPLPVSMNELEEVAESLQCDAILLKKDENTVDLIRCPPHSILRLAQASQHTITIGSETRVSFITNYEDVN